MKRFGNRLNQLVWAELRLWQDGKTSAGLDQLLSIRCLMVSCCVFPRHDYGRFT